MNYLILSTSLHESSRSRAMCQAAATHFASNGIAVDHIDLRSLELPICDGGSAWNHPGTAALKESIARADGILLGLGIYNYAASAAAKTAIELGGDAWGEKVVGLLCAAGGQASYMAGLGLANSLMLDFRTVIVPRFVYANAESFDEDQLADSAIDNRIGDLTSTLIRMTSALRAAEPSKAP